MKPSVLHLVDSLHIGGTERVAVNLANALPKTDFDVHLCVSRKTGRLQKDLSDAVQFVHLDRKSRFDLFALARFVRYLRKHKIQIVHAHSTSLFLAVMAAVWVPGLKVVWHDHFGRYLTEPRPIWLYRLLTYSIAHVFSVNQGLADWSMSQLRLSAEQVTYLPNFVLHTINRPLASALPSEKEWRIVCVANFRPQKDHHNLIQAMAEVVQQYPLAHLLLIGASNDLDYLESIRNKIVTLNLEQSVTILGQRNDIAAILESCTVGVLSSESEGLPLALLEYGEAGLATVATEVGQCAEVLDEGRVGLLVPAHESHRLAKAIQNLLESTSQGTSLGPLFKQWVQKHYSATAAIQQVAHTYRQLLGVKL